MPFNQAIIYDMANLLRESGPKKHGMHQPKPLSTIRMTKLSLSIGDIVQETYRGHYSHKAFHGD